MGFLITRFIVIVGGGWLLGKGIGNALFPKNEDDYYKPYKPYKPTYLESFIAKIFTEKQVASDKPASQIAEAKNYSTTDKFNIFDKDDSFRSNKTKKTINEIITDVRTVSYKDDFTDYTKVYFTDIGEKDEEFVRMAYDGSTGYENIGFTFLISNNKFLFLKLSTDVKEMGLAKGDELIVIFEDGTRIPFKFESAGVINVQNSIRISLEQLKEFATKKIDKWRLSSTRRNLFIVGNNSVLINDSPFSNKESIQKIFQFLAWKTGNEYLTLNGYRPVNNDYEEDNSLFSKPLN